jgi:hypothetical protein
VAAGGYLVWAGYSLFTHRAFKRGENPLSLLLPLLSGEGFTLRGFTLKGTEGVRWIER